MGIVVTVEVEGEEQSPIDDQTDGKPLADIVVGWIWYPEVVELLGLSPESKQALQQLDDSTYGGEDQKPKDVWQDPKNLHAAFKEVQTIYKRIEADSSILKKVDKVSKGNATNYFKPEWFEGYLLGIEDAIKICEWAIQHNKKVRLVAD